MSAPMEERLADLFSAVDSQVVAPSRPDVDARELGPPSLTSRTGPSRRPVALAVAVAAAISVLAIAATLFWRTDHDVSDVVSSPAVVEPAVFDGQADQVCDALARARTGVRPRFDTLEARQAVARSRTAAIDRARSDLLVMARPADDPSLPGRVADDLSAARAAAQSVLDQTTAAAAAAQWALIDPAIDRAIAPLGEHGAPSCRT